MSRAGDVSYQMVLTLRIQKYDIIEWAKAEQGQRFKPCEGKLVRILQDGEWLEVHKNRAERRALQRKMKLHTKYFRNQLDSFHWYNKDTYELTDEWR